MTVPWKPVPVYSVQMTVSVDVRVPVGVTLDASRVKELAMSAVTPRHEVDCGPPGKIVWAQIDAEVDEGECEIVDGVT